MKTERQNGYTITDILSDDHIDAEERANEQIKGQRLVKTILTAYDEFKTKGMIDPTILELLADVFGARDTANALEQRAKQKLSNE